MSCETSLPHSHPQCPRLYKGRMESSNALQDLWAFFSEGVTLGSSKQATQMPPLWSYSKWQKVISMVGKLYVQMELIESDFSPASDIYFGGE